MDTSSTDTTDHYHHRRQGGHIDHKQSSPLVPGGQSWASSSTTPATPITQASSIGHGGGDDDDEPIQVVPPPWVLRGDVYFFSFWTTRAQARSMPSHAYSPLEASSGFAARDSSKPVGGLSMVQILRYRDSPVGPYDELLLVPGSFDWTREDKGGKSIRGRNPKITRIYVSQKRSCYNGRLNWNTPKHLAKFEWSHGPDGSTTVKVYPHDTTADANEASPSPVPFFCATFKPMRLAPRFPFATRWVSCLGFDTMLVMPPLPEGRGSQGELPGTSRWCSLMPQQYSRRTMVGWFDLSQRDGEGGGGSGSGSEEAARPCQKLWPRLGRWQLGMKMEDAELEFAHPMETWEDAAAAAAAAAAAPSRSNL